MLKSIKTALLLAAISGIFLAIGYFIGGSTGLTIALLLSVAMNVGSYWFSHRIVLAMHQAQPVAETEELFQQVRILSEKANLPVPKVYRYDSPQPNAFATGRDPKHGVVAVSTGLLQNLDEEELKGVIAHELAHIQNRDMLVSTVAATFAAAISYMGNFLLFIPASGDEESPNPMYALFTMIAAPIIASILQMTISRTREYLADETGAKIAGSSQGLVSALRKIDSLHSRAGQQAETLGQTATAHMYIANPFRGGRILSLFSTHPPMEERVKRLQQLQV